MRIIKNSAVVVALFTVLGIFIYSNTFNSPFHYDDSINIVENPNVHWDKLSLDNVKKLFVWEGRPVSYLTFALNYYFGGLDVRGFHYLNIIIHILTAIGFFLLMQSILELPHLAERFRGKSKNIAFVAALLWLVSPLQIQGVTYIVQRMAALAAMFYIYAIYFYLRGRLSPGRQGYLFYALTFISALLAFGSKENANTLPLYLILLEIIVIRGGSSIAFLSDKKVLAILAILASLAIVSLGILYVSYSEPLKAQIGPWFTYWLSTRFLTGTRIIIFYGMQLLFPVPSRLSLEHDFQLSYSMFDPPVTFFTVLFVCGVIFYAIMSLKKHPLFSFFTIWFLGNLAIETFYPYLILVFEHRLYLPSMGFFAIVAIGFDRILTFQKDKRLRRLGILGLLIIIALFSINTYIRNEAWKDGYSLWSDVIKKNPNLASGYVGVGSAYAKDDDYEGALSYYLKAKSIEPRNLLIIYNLGSTYFELHRYDDAIREFSALGSMGYVSVGNNPSISYYFSRITKNYYGHGRIEEAMKVLDNALLYDPNETMLTELKEKIEKGTITAKEVMQK